MTCSPYIEFWREYTKQMITYWFKFWFPWINPTEFDKMREEYERGRMTE